MAIKWNKLDITKPLYNNIDWFQVFIYKFEVMPSKMDIIEDNFK